MDDDHRMTHHEFVPVETHDGMMDIPPVKIDRDVLDHVMTDFQEAYPALHSFSMKQREGRREPPESGVVELALGRTNRPR